MLKATSITKTYQTTILHSVDLEVPDGQFVAVMGPSGSGKSTLLHILSGMDTPTGGTVELAGQQLTSLDQKELAAMRLRRVGFVFQQPHLLRSLTVFDNIVLPGLMAGDMPRDAVLQRGRQLMEQMGISEIADHDVTQASGGQLQRAGICRALINEPGVVFGDEPTGALNSATAAQILDLLVDVNRAGTTVVLVTHDPVAASRAERLVMLVDGRVAADLDLGAWDPADAQPRLERIAGQLALQGV